MEKSRHKVLIINLGHSETLVSDVSDTCSLGDVFRTTVILHLYRNDHVTWVTDPVALPLLEGNPYIDRLLAFDMVTAFQLEAERFDIVINLEKIPGICALVERINAWSRYGFGFDEATGTARPYDFAQEAFLIATREDVKKMNRKSWAEVVYAALGSRWDGQGYVLGYTPTTEEAHDIGFNHAVGPKFPDKRWPAEHWARLEELIGGRYSISYQEGFDDLHRYADWINSCRMLVTNDSLGCYLGIALGKRVLILVGPTVGEELLPVENRRLLTPDLQRNCIPCCGSTCALGDPCIAHISPEEVAAAIDAWGGE